MNFATNWTARAGVELVGSADLFDTAGVHDNDPVRKGQRLGLGMGDEHERNAQMALQQLELVLNALAQIGVERAQRLVEKQDVRLDHEGACERDALLLPARQSLRLEVADVGQPEFFENALNLGVAGRRRVSF